jgi:Transglutaminase-like superfamily
MRNIFLGLFISVINVTVAQQPVKRSDVFQKIDTVNLNLADFAKKVTGNETDDFERAKKILYWLSSNLEWKYTDYVSRTVNQIIDRGGGNCFELAKVYMAVIKAAGIQYRSTAEIMIYPASARRFGNATEKIREWGFRGSVFGYQHNDHRWVEIYNKKTNEWEPADPTMAVIGTNDWLKARMSFGLRMTIDTANSNEMINSVAIFVTDKNHLPDESRTKYYLIDKFDAFYKGRLSKLPVWNDWVNAVNALTEPCKNAFLGKENLHLYQDKVSTVAEAYKELKKVYLEKNKE